MSGIVQVSGIDLFLHQVVSALVFLLAGYLIRKHRDVINSAPVILFPIIVLVVLLLVFLWVALTAG